MPYKTIIILIILLAGWLFYRNNTNEILEPVAIKSPPAVEATDTDFSNLDVEVSQVSKLELTPNIDSTTLDQAEEKMSSFMVMETYGFCYRYFSSKKNNDSNILKQFDERFTDLQKQYFEDYYDYCEQVNQEHPEYHLTASSKIKKKFEDKKDNALWTQIVKGDIEFESLTTEEIEGLITSNDIEILTQAPNFLRPYYQEVIHWGIQDVLQNHHYDYVSYILRNAHQLYMCDIGTDCSEQSSIMATNCFLTAESCGLDFPSYVETVLTSGQQQDIILAYNYLLGKYNPK